MRITKLIHLSTLLLLLLALVACNPAVTNSVSEQAIAIPPEPTNTPVPLNAEETIQLSDRAVLADLLNNLQGGGYVLYVRHTHTDRSRGDEDVSLGQCDQQRILSERGRDEALMMREAYQQLNLPVDMVLSTQYCRTLETAVLAFGVPQFTSRAELTDSLTARLATVPPAGTNTIIVAHIGTIRNAIGLDDTFEEGDTLIYRPTGDGTFVFAGRIGLNDWPVLAEIAGE